MSCVNALHTQIATLFLAPHEVLLLRHKVFREYAKIAVSPDFVHTLPSFLILSAAVYVIWKHPPSSTRIAQLVGTTFVYKSFQVLGSWFAINASLWLWLILQRILYCSVWCYWSYEFEYRDISYPWWQRVWSSYYPIRVQPVMSADFISWIITMLIAVTVLECAISTDQIFILDALIKIRDIFVNFFCLTMWPWQRTQEAVVNTEANVAKEDSEIDSVSEDSRSEMSIDTNNAARGDVIHPISYGTNWTPQPNFSTFKEAQRKISMKSLTGVNDNQLMNSQKPVKANKRHRRGCHTVIPTNSSEHLSER